MPTVSEREAVVAWLLKEAGRSPNVYLTDLAKVAQAIRRGEHLAKCDHDLQPAGTVGSGVVVYECRRCGLTEERDVS